MEYGKVLAVRPQHGDRRVGMTASVILIASGRDAARPGFSVFNPMPDLGALAISQPFPASAVYSASTCHPAHIPLGIRPS